MSKSFQNPRGFDTEAFWTKTRRTLGKVPFLEDAVAAYYCALDPATPTRVRGVLLTALAYFVLPTDMVPDFILGFGFTDDATVLATAIGVVSGHIREPHRIAANQFLEKEMS
ncbi:MAG: DUF1232 domain-containing protein [Alphaproteobacteria bacterium]|nr:MAG: DUF1232 domain-containing protein [Alphaproteobacteria bacterium]